jgi:hypothetical protein
MASYRVTLRTRTGAVDPVFELHGAVQFIAGVAYVDADSRFLAAFRASGRRSSIEQADPPEGWPPAVAVTSVGRALGKRVRPTPFGRRLRNFDPPAVI